MSHRRSLVPMLTVAVAFGLLSSAWLAPPANAEWTGTLTDDQISFDDNEYARAAQIHFQEGSGVIHVLWAEDAPTDRELHYGRSTDMGGTWSSEGNDRVISFPDGNDLYEECDAVVYDGQKVAVVWSEEHAGFREVHFGISLDAGVTWSSSSADQVISDPASATNCSFPSITCDLDGVLHVVWHQTSQAGTAEVHYGRSLDDGATWSSESADRVISFPDGQPALEPRIAVSGEKLYVIWREDDAAGDPHIHVGVSDDGGDTWTSESADREISPATTLMTDAEVSAVSFRPENGVVVVYRASYDTSAPFYYEVYSTQTFDEGLTWSGESFLTPVSHDEGAGRSASNPDVFMRDLSGAWAVWDEEDDVSGTKEQHVSWFDGGSWSGAAGDEIISFPDGENGYRPSITGHHWVAGPGPRSRFETLWVAWTEFAGGATDNYEVHLSILDEPVGSVDEPEPALNWARAWPSLSREVTQIELSMEQAGPIQIEILDAQGRVVHRQERILDAGSTRLVWNGRDLSGRRVPAGRYTALVRGAAGQTAVPLIRF